MLIKQRDRLFELVTPDSLKFVYVEGKGLGLFVNKDFKAGEQIISFENTFVDTGTSKSVQVGDDKHFDTEWLKPTAFVDHSCEPNAKFDFRPTEPKSVYVAIKDIKKDEAITFNYLTTEWDMVAGFKCECGSTKCYKEIKGFKYLTKEQQEELKPQVLPYIVAKLQLG